MPKHHERKKYIKQLDQLIMKNEKYQNLNFSDSEEEELIEKQLLDLIGIKEFLLKKKSPISPEIKIPKRLAYQQKVFILLPESAFKSQVRMKMQSFNFILQKIKDNDAFKNKCAYKQEEVWVQLMVTLERLGSKESAVGPTAKALNLGHATVALYIKRVIKALLSLEPDLIKFPNESRRKRISARFEKLYDLPGCIGILSGVEFFLSQSPAIDSCRYHVKNNKYSVNTQLICDDKGQIIYAFEPQPPTQSNSEIFEKCPIFNDTANYLSKNQYFLAGSSYKLSSILITPFKERKFLDFDTLFNEKHRKVTSTMKKLKGNLKSRWGSLLAIRNQLGKLEDFTRLNHWITSCLILHNAMIVLDDPWEEEVHYGDEKLLVFDGNDVGEGQNIREKILAKLISY